MKRMLFSLLAAASMAAAGAPTQVLLFFDTEDYTSDRSNDAIRDIANLLTEEGVVGHFNIVGLLCQELVRLRRVDVLDALKGHAIGTQTYGHSLHPAICELSDLEDFDEAYRLVAAQESEGIGMIKAATGVDRLIFQDPPGNSWSYVSFYVYADLGIRFICGGGFTDHPMTSGGAYGAGGIVRRNNVAKGLWYCNTYQVPYTHLCTLESFLPCAGHSGPNVDKIVETMAQRDMVALYMHPHMAVKTQHWDGPNYKRRNNVKWGEWIQVPDRDPRDTAEFYRRLKAFVHRIKTDPRFEIGDLRTFEKTLKPRVPITRADVPAIRAALAKRLSAVDLPKSWSVSDCFQAAVAMLAGAQTYHPEKSWGFLSRPIGVTSEKMVRVADLKAAAARLRKNYFVPPQIDVAGEKIGPADFLFAALDALASGAETIRIVPREQLGSFEEVPALEKIDIKAGWCIHADTFEDKYCSERLKLQLWTLRIE